jgi:hypothetical protein
LKRESRHWKNAWRASNKAPVSAVAAAEQREAAFGSAAVVNSCYAVFQGNRVYRVYDGFAAERRLALLGSCYRNVFNVE